MGDTTTEDLPIENKLDQILNLVRGIDARQISLDELVRGIDIRLTSLEELVDARLKDTRPIWEGVLTELKEQRKVLQSLERRFDIFAIESSKIKGDVLDILTRVEDLERKAS
jgi:hypothetical protein